MRKDYKKFIEELVDLPTETEWVEFKVNHQPPKKIGEYISALANSASVHQRREAFLVFGVENNTHKIVGTKFNVRSTKGNGNENLEPWLHRNLKPKHEFSIKEVKYDDKIIVIFFVKPAMNGPVSFCYKKVCKKYIRVSSNNQELDKFPEKEAMIWDRRISFERKLAKENVNGDNVLKLLDYDKYYILTEKTLPKQTSGILDKFIEEEFLVKIDGQLHITNLGAILFARDITQFATLKNKTVRIITYSGINKLNAIKDISGSKGYAVGFYGMVEYIKNQIPEVESIKGALRQTTSMYPEEAIREFVANALVHQDFAIQGSSPTIEIFSNRIEIYNAGTPLVDPLRFMDSEPRSRNEKLTDTLRRIKICEKRGSGVDRAVFTLESMQLPAPKIEKNDNGVKVTLYAYKTLIDLTKDEKIRACYFHSQKKYLVDHEPMTNSSLCKRLGIEIKNQSIASRIIKDTLESGLIKKFDPNNKSTRYVKYVPFYA